ncbi:MAG: hypothetical protein L0Z68_04905, partial [Gammaproteobacteria bacterium]|nr:hypothetical protein [Gammaproteobacteria bacterium]
MITTAIAHGTWQKNGQSSTLAVILHAPTFCPEQLSHLEQAIREHLPDADLLVPRLPLAVTSNADPVTVATSVVEMIDRAERR